MYKYVEDLAAKIGPRGSATRAERTAAQYVVEQLTEADEVVLQPFRSVPTFSWAFGLHYFLAVLAALLIPRWPVAAMFVAVLNAWGYWQESHTREFFTRVLPKDKSQNVIARKFRRPGTGKLPRLILVAHYDTSRSGLNFHPKLVAGFRQAFVIMNLSLAAIVILATIAGIAALTGLNLPGLYAYLALPFALYLFFTVLLLVHREIWGQYVPGGNDNASGVAVLIHSFNHLARQMPPGAELWAVATGCEEAGTVGMLRFLEEFGEEISDDYILNLDNLGIGEVKYVTAEGLFKAMPANRELVLAAAAFAREQGKGKVGPHVYQSLTTDATPALVRGYKVMSIMAFTPEGILPHWHWPSDRAEHVSPENLETAHGLVCAIAGQLWRQTGEPRAKQVQ